MLYPSMCELFRTAVCLSWCLAAALFLVRAGRCGFRVSIGLPVWHVACSDSQCRVGYGLCDRRRERRKDREVFREKRQAAVVSNYARSVEPKGSQGDRL